MKKWSLLLVFFLAANIMFAQSSYIVITSVSPYQLTTQGITTNSVSQGMKVLPKGTYAYFSAKGLDAAGNTELPVVGDVTYTLVTKPNGSNASLTTYATNKVHFLADSTGKYQVTASITTSAGTNVDTVTLYASNYIGVGNFEGVTGSAPRCMMCHTNATGTTPSLTPIWTAWSTSAHAQSFKNKITDPAQTHFGTSCYKCHTTGSDNNLVVSNGGFDDIAASLNWVIGTPNAGKWDTLKTSYSKLTNMATIGCESCHGAGSSHYSTSGDRKGSIQISKADGVCDKCHDSPWRYPQANQFRNSMHSEAVWSSSFKKNNATTTYNLDACIRCHDGDGFVNFVKGNAKDYSTLTLKGHVGVTCATCHDPHGNGKPYNLRVAPAGSDTLGNGASYTAVGGNGQLCFNCHKARSSSVTVLKSAISSRWGPHHATQADVFLGDNAAAFDATPFASTAHKDMVTDACVTCHMSATTDTSDHANRDMVGGHSWHMVNEATGYANTKVCTNCHEPKANFGEFVASSDYDGNGKTEGIQTEIKGLLKKLAITLPHTGGDTLPVVSTTLIAKSADSTNMKKAYWNYQLIANDGSNGMHNAAFAVDVLVKSIKAIGGTIDVKDVKLGVRKYSLDQNYPNPFNPTTTIKFSVPEAGVVKIKVYDAMGNLVKELYNQYVQQGNFNAVWNGTDIRGNKVASGIYFYKLESPNFTLSKKMILMK